MAWLLQQMLFYLTFDFVDTIRFDFQTVWVKKNHIWVHSVGQGLRQMENHQHGAISTDI